MTQHLPQEHSEEDHRTMLRLALVAGYFIAFTSALAIGIGVTMG